MDLGLTGKTAVVTGGGGGIGAGIARALAREGARVAVADIRIDNARAVAESIPGDAIALECDVSDRDAVRRAVERVVRELDTVHVLVNNVGLTLPNWLCDITDEDIERTFSVNCLGHLLPTVAVLPHMRANRWGRLVFVGSGSGMKASAGLAMYSAGKYFVRGLAVSAGLEAGKDNITANVICPSDVYPEGDTPAGSWANPRLVKMTLEKEGSDDLEEIKAKRIARTPVRRSCTIDDIADLAVFLASERAGFINAQTLGLNGGALPT